MTIPAVLAVWLATVIAAGAQGLEQRRRAASFTAGASLGDGETALALSAGIDLRLSHRVGLAIEADYARSLDFTFDLCPPPLVCVRGGQFPVTGRTVSLVPHLVFELLPSARRVRAYAQAGVGAGHVRQRYFLDAVPGPEAVEFTRSSTALALSIGGGVSMKVSRRLDVGIDVRSLHLLDNDAEAERFITPAGAPDTLRVGARIRWRF